MDFVFDLLVVGGLKRFLWGGLSIGLFILWGLLRKKTSVSRFVLTFALVMSSVSYCYIVAQGESQSQIAEGTEWAMAWIGFCGMTFPIYGLWMIYRLKRGALDIGEGGVWADAAKGLDWRGHTCFGIVFATLIMAFASFYTTMEFEVWERMAANKRHIVAAAQEFGPAALKSRKIRDAGVVRPSDNFYAVDFASGLTILPDRLTKKFERVQKEGIATTDRKRVAYNVARQEYVYQANRLVKGIEGYPEGVAFYAETDRDGIYLAFMGDMLLYVVLIMLTLCGWFGVAVHASAASRRVKHAVVMASVEAESKPHKSIFGDDN